MQNTKLFEEPIELIFSEKLLFGSELENILLDVNEVVKQFFENDEFSIINLVEEEISKFIFHPEYKLYKEMIDDLLMENHDKLDKKYLIYRKAKIRKENTKYDDFFFSVFDEVYDNLRVIALHRAIYGIDKNSNLEKMFLIYKQGNLPYKFENSEFHIFNPAILK